MEAWDIRLVRMSPSVAALAATFLLHVTSYGGDVQPAALGLSPGGRLTGKGAVFLSLTGAGGGARHGYACFAPVGGRLSVAAVMGSDVFRHLGFLTSDLWHLFFPLGRGECEKGIWWMPWRREAMKDVARCDKPWGAASRL